MLIKGVTGGNQKGNPIEYTPEEKYPLAVKKFLKDAAPEGMLYLFEDVKIENPSYVSNGVGKKGYANNTYSVSGKVWYKVLEVETDHLLPVRESAFDLEFTDGVDDLGVPDIQSTKFILH